MRAACAALALALPAAADAQESFTVYIRGVAAGAEQIGVARTAEGWTINGSGRLAASVDLVTRRLQVRYDAEWKPIDLTIDATMRAQPLSLRTTVSGTTATSHVVNGGQVADKVDQVAADAVLLPSPFWAPFAALAQRTRDAAPGTTVHAYIPGQASFDIRVGESSPEQIQTVSGLVVARRTAIALAIPNAPLDGEIWSDPVGRLLRLTIPGQGLDVVREDIAAVSSRRVTISRANDEQVKIGGSGFTLVGTLSRPEHVSGRLPAVVLVGGSGPQDRDELVSGIPILGQLAGAIANAGFAVLRYDKRGVGQSGGRTESASLADFAEDVRAAVKMLSDRKDIDPKRIAVIGHSEGAAIALLAASKDKRIAAVGLLEAHGTSGADLILAQQKRALDRLTLTSEEKQAKIELQKRVNEAVITGKGLDQLPPEIRRQMDNAEFQSLLANDPAKVMPDVKQPLLIVHGSLDMQVEPSNADRLEALARKRKNSPPVDVVRVAGVNHLLVPATTGEADEYASLKDKNVSPSVIQPIVTWLQKTLVPAK
jgi:pimeloyl-ACP methyl ester carboxylesterase